MDLSAPKVQRHRPRGLGQVSALPGFATMQTMQNPCVIGPFYPFSGRVKGWLLPASHSESFHLKVPLHCNMGHVILSLPLVEAGNGS